MHAMTSCGERARVYLEAGARQRPQVGRDRALAGGGRRQQLAAVVVLQEAAVEQAGEAVDELVEPERGRLLEVVVHERHPRLGDRAVVLVRRAVGGGDVPDRVLHPPHGHVAVVLAQLAPGQADVLTMPELARRAEDVGGDVVHGRV